MKIHFFKNEEHICPRHSLLYENGCIHSSNERYRHLPTVIQIIGIISVVIYAALSHFERTEIVALCIFTLFLLPLHEFSHVLGCLFTGNRVERVCFLPYKFKIGFNTLGGYVVTEFNVYSKFKKVVISIFPILTLTVLPLMLSFYLNDVRDSLVIFAVLNFATSCFDIKDIINYITMPRRALCFGGVWFTPDDGKIFKLHRFYVLGDKSKLYHREYMYINGKLVEIDEVSEPEYALHTIKEFKEQFNIE